MIEYFARLLIKAARLSMFRKKWRKQNTDNYTIAGNTFPINKVKVGKMTYGVLNVKTYGNIHEQLEIGSYCSIAGDVKFLLGGEHNYSGLSTYPFNKYVLDKREETITKGPIIIKDDVWIGENVLILSGVTIGQGAVIAAGSVVSKDIPPYAVFGGGKILKYRFDQEMIRTMSNFSFKDLDNKKIIKNIQFLYSPLKPNSLEADIHKFLSGEIINE